MADRKAPRARALTALLPGLPSGLAEAVKRKIVGRLLLDGGTVEEPGRGTHALSLPRRERRPLLRWGSRGGARVHR